MNNKIEISTHPHPHPHPDSPTEGPTAGEVVYLIPWQSLRSLSVWKVVERKGNLKFSSWGCGHTQLNDRLTNLSIPYVVCVCVCLHMCVCVCGRPQGSHKGEKRSECGPGARCCLTFLIGGKSWGSNENEKFSQAVQTKGIPRRD